MRKYIQYIFLSLILCISTVSCIEELDAPQIMQENEELTLVPRVKSFTNQYVTKSDYTGNETKIETLSLLVFDSDGKLVHLHEGSGGSVIINKSMLNSPDKKEKLESATVVMFANISIDKICDAGGKSINYNKEVLTLDDMKNYTCHWDEEKTVVTDLGDNFTGFPMVGGKKGVDLTATRTQQALIEVPLKILYAKINFSIAVAPGTENEGTGMNFQLNRYTVNNVSKATVLKDLNIEGEETGTVDESSEATASDDYAFTSDAAPGNANGTAVLNGQPVGFTFYVAESRYNHNSDLKGIYPDDNWLTEKDDEDVKGWSSMSEEEKEKNILNGVKYFYDDLIQQYKPKLAEVDGGEPGIGLATYVTLYGTYTDYRGTVWDVNYKVYLGKDNAHNFHVDRNSAYTNYITIKGIRNNGSYGEDQVWVDHRVDVTYNGSGVDDHVTITRETLLDAHIEVRPLRVKWTDSEFDGVRVYLPTDSEGNLIDWIGIERYTGKNNQEGSVYCYADGKSTGKRKYFTTDLISELQNKEGEYGVRVDEDTNKKYIYLLNEECAWIYFDENTDSSSDREAEIILEFYTTSGSNQTVVYNVKQRGLQTVGGYAIESYEEYLHSYDSSDKYDLSTSPVDYTQQGLAWGYDGHKISQNFLVSSAVVPTTALKNEMVKSYSYDFFHESDGSDYNLYTKVSGSWANGSFGTGLDFTDRASANRDIAVKDMGTMPENAYQYCLSKNKFEADDLGSVTMTLNWYLPDPYEMQAILVASQSGNSPVDIDADAFYWSSQPSFDSELITYINYIYEDITNARAVSAQEITNHLRKNQNRIRCVYAKNGINLDEEDMEDRVPDGIGGNYSVMMKAWNNGSVGYFNYLLPEAKLDESFTDWVYNTTETNYPNADNADSISGEKFNYVRTEDKDGNPIEGFNINPGETSSWTEYALRDGYYTTLATYPGLTEFTLTELPIIGGAYQPSTTKKSGTQTVTSKMFKVLDKKLPSTTDLRTLDHLTNGSMVNISFDQSKGTTLPAFAYDETVSGTQTTNTKYWIKPEYSLKQYPLNPENYTKEEGGEGSETGISTGTSTYQQANVDDAKENAFDGTLKTSTLTNRVDGAYTNAKNDAKAKLDEILKAYPTSEGWVHSVIDYEEVFYSATNTANIQWTEPQIETTTVTTFWGSTYTYTSKVTITCTVTVTASVTVTKPSVGEVFVQVDGTGKWGDSVPDPDDLDPAINTDELRMYCGNSFTISLSEEAKQQGYEITKVKVHYSGDNHVGTYNEILGLGGDNIYARFVDSSINLADYKLENQYYGSTEVLQLPGMDYSADGAAGWHQWTGEGSNFITLILADYNINYNKGTLNYTYLYDSSPQEPGKYIVVDQIEVKCTKKKNATFDFKKIYDENVNTETSEWTLKHITFTAEGGTEDAPTAAITADGLKLYAGSKVTFNALDGYVINSISGDPDLTFIGSQQTVEFTNLPEKTISNEIIVLYSKLETE